MCHFITLIAATSDSDLLAAVMKRHGRTAKPIDNPSVREVLRAGERQFLTTRGHCDCGTVLASRHGSPESIKARLAAERTRLRRKGWSEAKIARSLSDKWEASARPGAAGVDSLEQWTAALWDAAATLKLSSVGLFLGFYSGNVATEFFAASRREVPPDLPMLEALRSVKEEELTVFSMRGAVA